MPYSIVYQGTMYLPVWKVSELLGVDIDWDGATGNVKIGSKVPYYADYPSVPDFGAVFEVPVYAGTEDYFAYKRDDAPIDALSEYKKLLVNVGYFATDTYWTDEGYMVQTFTNGISVVTIRGANLSDTDVFLIYVKDLVLE